MVEDLAPRVTRRLRHSGNYKYAWAIAVSARRLLPPSLPYPKPRGFPNAPPLSFPLFESIWSPSREIAVTPEVTALNSGAVVAVGVSGGKDSAATAFATIDYLNQMGHQGPRLLIHSDLGRVEWRESMPVCERLAGRLELDLLVVRRESSDLLDRWHVRWENNIRRYAELRCVKLIMPSSAASMRFCTSELKTAVISRALVKRFPNQIILSTSGIRRQESPKRARAPVTKAQAKLCSTSRCSSGMDWRPILEWTTQQVFENFGTETVCAARSVPSLWFVSRFLLFLHPQFTK